MCWIFCSSIGIGIFKILATGILYGFPIDNGGIYYMDGVLG